MLGGQHSRGVCFFSEFPTPCILVFNFQTLLDVKSRCNRNWPSWGDLSWALFHDISVSWCWTHVFSYKALGMLVWSRKGANRSTDRWRTGTGWGGVGVLMSVLQGRWGHIFLVQLAQYQGPLGLPQPLFDPLPPTALLWQGLLPGLGFYENLGKCWIPCRLYTVPGLSCMRTEHIFKRTVAGL